MSSAAASPSRSVLPLVFCLWITMTCTGAGAVAAGVEKKEPYPVAKPPFLALVEKGCARAVIVPPRAPSPIEAHAVKELVEYVRKITGAELKLAVQAGENHLPIYIGSAARKGLGDVNWARLKDDAFVLSSGPDGVYIAGAKDLGTLYGVYQFLEKHLGVRWFMPGQLGEVVPNSDGLVIGTFEEIEIPSFRVRWIESGDWALRQKMNVSVQLGDKPVGINWRWSFHTHFRLVPPERHYADHPEWFALIGGKRRHPVPGRQNQQLCTSNPEVIEEMARSIIKTFDEDPSLDILAMAPQDGGGFCQCEACRALDETRPADQAWHATYSGRLAVFNNEVARRVANKHPDRLIKVGAYAMYLRVPLDPDYRPEPNLAVQVCHTYSCNSHPIASETCPGNTRYFRKELEHWAKIASHLFIYEYYNKGVWGGLPYHQVHLLREDVPYYHGLGAEGFYTQPAGGRWPACGLNHYIAAKLSWDVDLDVDKLLEDFYQKFYAEAAGPMRRYWQALRRAFAQYDECLSPFGRKWTTLVVPEIFTPQTLADLEDAVSRAEKAAGSEVIRNRVHLVRVRVDYAKRVMDYLAAVRAPFAGVDLSDPQAVAAAHKKAVKLGVPLSQELKEFCKQNNLPVVPRLVEAHKTPGFIVELPGRKRVLQ